MKVKQLSLIAVILFTFTFVSFVIAGDPPKPPVPILKPGDVKHFIKTFPHLTKDFKKFGALYEAKTGDLTVPEALKVNKNFLEILKKHGWDEHFFQKASIIFLGYSGIVYGKEIKKAGPGIEKSLKQNVERRIQNAEEDQDLVCLSINCGVF